MKHGTRKQVETKRNKDEASVFAIIIIALLHLHRIIHLNLFFYCTKIVNSKSCVFHIMFVRPLPCFRCRHYRRKCSLNKPTCDRCARLGHVCEYPPLPMKSTTPRGRKKHTTPSGLPSPAASSSPATCAVVQMDSANAPDPISHPLQQAHKGLHQPQPLIEQCAKLFDTCLQTLEENNWTPRDKSTVCKTPNQSVLNHVITVSETSLMDEQEITSWECWSIQHPDLIATLEEYFLVLNASTLHGANLPIFFSFDGDHFLSTFFQQPPFFRLIQCAMSAVKLGSDAVARNFYSRARKACIRALNHKPTYYVVQSLYTLVLFIRWSGQPDLAKPFLKTALDLIKALRLDIDPNDSPWLSHLNLTPRQKEDRRRTFWSVYWIMLIDQITSSQCIEYPITAEKMNPPTTVNDPYPIFQACSVHIVCELFVVIIAIKKHYMNPPNTIDALKQASDTYTALHSQLLHVHSRIPSPMLLLSESAETLTESDYARFRAQRDSCNDVAAESFIYNTQVFASICILNRPVMYLASLKSCHPFNSSSSSNSLPNDDDSRFIATAINQCLDAAHRIIHLLSFFLDSKKSKQPPLVPLQNRAAYPLLEAMIILWFTSCRMDPSWWRVLGRKEPDWEMDLRNKMMSVVRYMKCLDVNNGSSNQELGGCGVVPPILLCMETMVTEIDAYKRDCCATTAATDITAAAATTTTKNTATITTTSSVTTANTTTPSCNPTDTDLKMITLQMKVVSLDGSNRDSEDREPKALLGLLGIDVGDDRGSGCVGDRVRWTGPSEESWRIFWKLYS
ncbi:hypothetical protein BDR26DRAFT_868633 [Obelidium mucronatum]|nr:hypothetical protein BDR26DRAFT_868633 [Obelidium mucronatum]